MKSSVHSDYNRDDFAPGYTPAGWGINPCFPAIMVGLTTGHLSCVCPLQLTLCNFSQDLGSNSFGRQRRGERGFRVRGLLLRVFVMPPLSPALLQDHQFTQTGKQMAVPQCSSSESTGSVPAEAKISHVGANPSGAFISVPRNLTFSKIRNQLERSRLCPAGY